ncbi:MAG: alpha/beta hydrolase [Betaproteobacteria bacterium]|nr:alpha/beta hydrolase [Betaproteobacteria bacterium]
MPYISVRGSNLHYLEAGNGKPIVCFHSTPASAQFYRPQLEHFGHGYRVIAVDLRGHGDSEKPRGPYRISEFLEDYVAIFDAFALKDFVLVGCSVGGIVAQLYALEHGRNLRGLVLIGAPCSRRGRDVAGFHKAVKEKGWEGVVRGLVDKQLHHATSPEVKEWAVREYLKTPLYVREAEEAALLAEVHHTDRVQEISVPTLLVAGEEEEKEIFEQMELMSRRIANAEWHVMKGAAHVPNFEKPREFNAILEQFLRKIDF